jgi:ABC-2 family transporter protein
MCVTGARCEPSSHFNCFTRPNWFACGEGLPANGGMTFLPVVERELRVASRKRSTFRVRTFAAVAALLIGTVFFLLATYGPGFGMLNLGKGLFSTLTWLNLAVALCAGLFFTSDCLSEEKREGTIGFLFLTDLRGHDVVLGKLLATSLKGASALLAVFPILAITLLMGGVTGVEFWKAVLALVNALIVSLAAGLFVSSISRDSQKALMGTLLLLLLLVGLGPLADSAISSALSRNFTPQLSLTSPGYLFMMSTGWQPTFWPSLLFNQLVAWTLMGLACVLLPRSWQEKVTKQSKAAANRSFVWKFGGPEARTARRRKLIEPNPVLWIACRERWQSATLWLFTLMIVAGTLLLCVFGEGNSVWQVWALFGGFFTLIMYLGMASNACRFFVEGRRSGLFELLLSTPLTAQQIVQGQWRGLLRNFGLPLLLWLLLIFAGTFLQQLGTMAQMSAAMATAATPTTTNTTTITTRSTTVTVKMGPFSSIRSLATAGGIKLSEYFLSAAMALATTLTVLGNLAALSWFGMWAGLNSKSANIATLKTLAFVQVIPWFGIAIASNMIFLPLMLWPALNTKLSGGGALAYIWYPLISTSVATMLALIKDTIFILWARKKLRTKFRDCILPVVTSVHEKLPPPLPRVATPVVSAN